MSASCRGACSQLTALSSAVGAVTSGAQLPPSPAAASTWGPDDSGIGGLPPVRGVSQLLLIQEP